MLDLVLDKLGDAHFMAFLLAALGCAATALTVVVPMLQTDNLSRRIKAVSDERERIRLRERERLAAKDNRTQLRSRPSSMLKRLVDTLNLTSWLSTETAKETAGQGRLPRRRGRIRLRRRPSHRPDRLRDHRDGLYLRRRRLAAAAGDQARRRDGGGLPRRQGAGDLSAQRHHASARSRSSAPIPTRST